MSSSTSEIPNSASSISNLKESTTGICLAESKHKFHYKSFLIGACLTFIAQPFEVLRTSSVFLNYWGTKPSELWNLSKYIHRKEGVKGFFRGGTVGAIKSSLGFGVFFNGIQNLPRVLKTEPKGPEHYIYNYVVNFFNGSIAMFFTTMASTPFIVLKTRFEVIGQTQYKSIVQAILQIKREDGFRGFYRGIIPTLLRDLPWSGAQYSIYQAMIGLYENILHKPANNNTPFIIVAGALSSSSAILMFYPFDNIRVRYQGIKGQNLPLSHLIPHIYQTEGIKGFYRGYLPRLLKKGAQGAVAWTIYEYLKKDIKKNQE